MAFLRQRLLCVGHEGCKFYNHADEMYLSQRHLRTTSGSDNTMLPLKYANPRTVTKHLLNKVNYFSSQYFKLNKVSNSDKTNTALGLAEEVLASKVKSPDDKEESEKEKQKDRENKARALKFSFYAFGGMMIFCGATFIYVYGQPLTNEYTGEPIIDEFSDMILPKQYIFRATNEMKVFNKMMQEPIREKLLPDPLKAPYMQPPYTLILEMKDVLVHPEWTYQSGWRFKKRPGLDFFLQHCAPPTFEIVIYTNEQGFTAFPVIEQLDTNGFIWYRLFRDSTRYVEGKHLKDLDCLNRDLKKVIVVDWDEGAITSRRNQLCIKRWKGNMDDQTLVDLGLMLRTISESQVDDVREVLEYYRTFEDPILAFRENQRAAEEQEVQLQKKAQEAAHQKSFIPSWMGSSFTKR